MRIPDGGPKAEKLTALVRISSDCSASGAIIQNRSEQGFLSALALLCQCRRVEVITGNEREHIELLEAQVELSK